ncbi:MAG: hypothetical protein ACQERN_11940, partial [Thermodesulfobacteriota bacterium]
LSDSGLIREIDSEEQTVQPARDLDLIRLSDIYAAIRAVDKSDWQVPAPMKNETIEALLESLHTTVDQQLGSHTLRDMA